MALSVAALHPNTTIVVPGLIIYSGIAECLFTAPINGIARDTLSFILPDPRISLIHQPIEAACVVSPASFAFDGPVSDALWAVDSTSVATVNEDRGTGTAQLKIFADLAVRGLHGLILRVNYSVYVRQ